ncbi:multifunctional oxoglutarate decarboxylase/oxoglutarate dehydrogenase thiamine pyrophosphate-binding subunit/dihydrolipoyllysine-residue succinyltransferase subunit, partial [Kitasatospora sp. NPDC085879]
MKRKRAVSAVSPHPEVPVNSSSPSAFGPNEWLVDEIYQQYLQDPNSVDRAWWDLFADYKPGGAAAPASAAAQGQNALTPAATAAVPAPAVAPVTAPPAPAPAPAAVSVPAPAAEPAPAARATDAAGAELVQLRGPAKAVASNMDASLEVPTATSVRAV